MRYNCIKSQITLNIRKLPVKRSCFALDNTILQATRLYAVRCGRIIKVSTRIFPRDHRNYVCVIAIVVTFVTFETAYENPEYVKITINFKGNVDKKKS